MALTRAFEEHEVGPDLGRIYQDIRTSFDLPFVPTVFKLAAGVPEYLRVLWWDLGPVARSKEFHAAAKALNELTRSLAVRGGWRFADQNKALAGERFSAPDIEALGEVPPVFTRAHCQMSLFARLLQRGYSGGQRGRVAQLKMASAMARIGRLEIPNEKESGLRGWLIYSDIRRTTGAKHVPSMFRLLSHFPGYLAATWVDAKKTLHDVEFQRSRDEFARRTLGLLAGLPVRDHRAATRRISEAEWRDIEEMVDGFARQLPQFALLSAVWQRSFPQHDVKARVAS